MIQPDWSAARRRVLALAHEPGARGVFGAWDRHGSFGHGFRLAAPLSEAEVFEAERQFGVVLPDDYRAFLLQVGAGGAGPSYGLSTLARRDGVWGWSGAGAATDTAQRSQPFPHDDAIWRRLAELEECEPHEEDFADQAAFQEAFRTWDARWQELDDRQTTGAICLCHHGCASYDWLVVSGPARGTMWLDDRATDQGITPRVGDDGTPLGFNGWYLDWLKEAERKACG